MKETGVLLFSLMIFITLSFATTQPKGGANLVGTQRARLNGFGEITGRVLVAESKRLLPGANVILLDTRSGAATDYSGMYRISSVSPGLYTLKAAYIGLISHEAQVQATVLDFGLAPDPDIIFNHVRVPKR